jgi:hypothetical protein
MQAHNPVIYDKHEDDILRSSIVADLRKIVADVEFFPNRTDEKSIIEEFHRYAESFKRKTFCLIAIKRLMRMVEARGGTSFIL